jgi:hypothetical protein
MLVSCYATLAVTASWGAAGILVLAFQCGLSVPSVVEPAEGSTCVGQFAIQLGLGIVSILTDFAIVALTAWMMCAVQVGILRKLAVVSLFGMRAA